MIEFEKPKIECLKLDNDNMYAKFVCEPLERGYGVTIGNSLRRILLSSLPGAAITSIKVDGVEHEFTTIPGIIEDVVEIILNLKSVRLKITDNEVHNLKISVKGEGEVTAADIVTDGVAEVLNPEQHICTITAGGKLNMELTANRGRGYNPSSKNKEPDQPLGVIAIDSIYTPVKKVNFFVENTRVGQITDYDKLTIELWTDGSMLPHEALSLAEKLYTDICNIIDGKNCRIGITSRSIRMVTGERLLLEAEQSIEHSDASSPIIAFRVDSEKYRQMIEMN